VAIAFRIGELEDAIGKLLLEFFLLEIEPCGVADVEPALVVHTAHHGMPHQRGRGGDFDGVSRGQSG